MEFSFIFSALLMVTLPLLLLIYNFLRPHNYIADDTQQRANILAARKKLAALKRDSADGIIDNRTEAEYSDEIRRQMLADVKKQEEQPVKTDSTPRTLFAGIVLSALFLLTAPIVYSYYGELEAISGDTAMQQDRLSREQMEEVVTQLKQRLAEQPENGGLAAVLAAHLLDLARYEEAADYYARARKQLGDNEQLALGELRARLGANQPDKAWQVAETALSIAPDSPYVLWLAGAAAEARGDTEKALSYWYSVHAMVTDNQVLEEIEKAIQALEARQTATDADSPRREITAGTRLQIQVAVADPLTQKIRASDTVFIFAKAATGPALPLAVARLRAGDLPARVTLDDSMAMTPELTLSAFQAYQVVARISQTGNATAAAGDLFGEQEAVPGETLTVIINQEVQ